MEKKLEVEPRFVYAANPTDYKNPSGESDYYEPEPAESKPKYERGWYMNSGTGLYSIKSTWKEYILESISTA